MLIFFPIVIDSRQSLNDKKSTTFTEAYLPAKKVELVKTFYFLVNKFCKEWIIQVTLPVGIVWSDKKAAYP